MSSWKGKTRGGLAGYQFFLLLLRYPGIKFTYFFLHFVVPYFILFAPLGRKAQYWYFRNIHHFSPLKSVRLIYKNFHVFGQVLIDKVALMANFNQKFTFNFDGEHILHEMAAQGGGILMGAHLGNWEIAGQLLERIDTKVHILMLEAEHEKIKGLLDNVMTKKSMDVIAIKDDFSHLLAIKEALQRNEIVAMHGDRFMPGSKTIDCPFMGYQATFPNGPFYLAVKFNKPVTFVSAVKESKTHYHFYATPPVVMPKATSIKARNELPAQLLELYVKELENTLKKYPEQWFNYYYFWDRHAKITPA